MIVSYIGVFSKDTYRAREGGLLDRRNRTGRWAGAALTQII